MKKLINITCLAMFLISFSGHSVGSQASASNNQQITKSVISSSGIAGSEKKASAIAESSLINQITTLIRHNKCIENKKQLERDFCNSLNFYFDFPIVGTTLESKKNHYRQIESRISLTKPAVEKNYAAKHQAAIAKLEPLLNKSKTGLTTEETSELWINYRMATSYELLIDLFGITTTKQLPESIQKDVHEILYQQANTIKNLGEISDHLVQLGEIKNVFIHAPIPNGSAEMTPFSERIRSLVQTSFHDRFPNANIKLRGLKAKSTAGSKACYDQVRQLEKKCPSRIQLVKKEPISSDLLLGSYTPYKDDLLLQYELINTLEGLKKSIAIKVPKALLKSLRYEPMDLKFDQSLHQNIIASNDLRAELSSSKGTRNILLYEQEDIALKLKANNPAYFYIVGHVIQSNQQYSYLVELDPESRSFVGQVSAEQANQWIEIGEFSIAPPFGSEHLQLVVASYDLSDSLPKVTYNPGSGYYIIDGSERNVSLGLSKVRGLQRICQASTTRGLQRTCDSKVPVKKESPQKASLIVPREHESVLSYTSMPLN